MTILLGTTIIFLGVFNDYASGLSYYYFIATLITIIQTMITRRFVDENALLAQIHAHKAIPSSKSNNSFSLKLNESTGSEYLLGPEGVMK